MRKDSERMIKVTIVKTGYIATTTLIDALLDERASRENISVRVVSSGCKMDKAEASDVAKIAAEIPTDLYIITSPNAGLPGPKAVRETLMKKEKPIYYKEKFDNLLANVKEKTGLSAREIQEKFNVDLGIRGINLICKGRGVLEVEEGIKFNDDSQNGRNNGKIKLPT